MQLLEKDRVEELVILAQQGDREAFGTLYSIYHQRVYYSALRLVKNEAVAEDIMQTVFTHVLLHISELKDPRVFESWLYRITYNVCMDELSQVTTLPLEWPQMVEIEDPDPDSCPHESFMIESRDDLLLDALDTLSEDHQQVLRMKYFWNMKIQEIARVLEISEGTVKSRLSYGRTYLKKKLRKSRNSGLLVTLPLAEALNADYLEHMLPKGQSQTILKNISGPDARLSEVRIKNKHRAWPQAALISGLVILLALSAGYAFNETTKPAAVLPVPESEQPAATASASKLPEVTSYEVLGDVVALTLQADGGQIDPASFRISTGGAPLGFDAATATVTLPFEKNAYTFTFADTQGNWQTVRIAGKEVVEKEN